MFSLPLIYTMEVWWAAVILSPLRITSYLLVTFALLMLYNRYAGLRRDASLREVAIDSVEEMGIGLVLSFLVLFMIGEIDFATMSLREIVNKTTLQSMAVAIGVSVGTAQLGVAQEDPDNSGADGTSNSGFPAQLALAFCGALLFAANIAPTDEVRLIALNASPERLLLLAISSIFLTAIIFYFVEFRGAARYASKPTWLLKFRGAIITYAVALVAAASSLWFFGQFDHMTWIGGLQETVVLGLPSALGASAGRLLIQPTSS